MKKTFVIADTHFSHKNILKFCSEHRPFKTIEEHDETLINNWNSVVTDKDDVYVLGDFFLGGYKNTNKIKEILSRLKGRKFLVMGNHDLHFTASQWLKFGFDRVLPMAVHAGCLLTHIPVDHREVRGFSKHGRYLCNIHGHLHDSGNTEELLSTGRYCVSAEQINLTPIEWRELQDRFIFSAKQFLPLEDANQCVYVNEGTVNMAAFDEHCRRIKGELVEISAKTVYDILDQTAEHIQLAENGNVLNYVKKKNFIGYKH